MKLHELSPAPGAKKAAKRVGRGHGSGHGKTAGRGHKGQLARSGKGMRAAFEGGQMPLARRVPKRGFNNIFAKKYCLVNVSTLDRFENGAVVDAKALIDAGIVKKGQKNIKILGNGDISKKLTVKVTAFSETAKQKIEAAGGTAEVV